ncbi:MAG: Stf0 family sulfotransferase [Pseudomonadota bacterium]
MRKPAKSYMICTTPRSGSTLLCGLLAATGCAGKPDSHFHVPSLPAWLESYGLIDQTFLTDRDAIGAVVNAAIERGTGDGEFFGLRLQHDSFTFFLSALDTLTPGCQSDTEMLEAVFGPMTILYLERYDKLAQAVSLSIAVQSGLWHRNADGSERERTAPNRTPSYDRANIQSHLSAVTAQNAAWRDWFASQRIAPYRFTYEDLADAPREVLADTLRILGQDPEAAANVPIPTAKLADETNAHWAARFRSETGS